MDGFKSGLNLSEVLSCFGYYCGTSLTYINGCAAAMEEEEEEHVVDVVSVVVVVVVVLPWRSRRGRSWRGVR